MFAHMFDGSETPFKTSDAYPFFISVSYRESLLDGVPNFYSQQTIALQPHKAYLGSLRQALVFCPELEAHPIYGKKSESHMRYDWE